MVWVKKTPEEYEQEAEWQGACLVHRHGYIPRKLYQLRHGDLPKHIHVCHHCDNRLCILDAHMFTGTASDNMKDCYAKGRSSFNELNTGPRPDISEANAKRKWSEQSKLKASSSTKGRIVSEETRTKLSRAADKRWYGRIYGGE